MIPAATYRVVGVRADGSKKVLCDGLHKVELAENIAKSLLDGSPFASITIERDDVPLTEPPAAPDVLFP